MNKRKITNPYKVKFEPFDNYGAPVHGMSWQKFLIIKKQDKAATF